MRFLILIFLLGCAKKPVPSELKPYIELFRSKVITTDKTNRRLNNIDFSIEELGDDRSIGICYPITLMGRAKIVISSKYFNTSSEAGKITTLLHELGHAVCHLPHTEPNDLQGFGDKAERLLFKMNILKKFDSLEDGCPVSLMYPSEFADECFYNHQDYYYEELKNKCK